MYCYTTWVKDVNGKVVYSTEDRSGNAQMDTLKYIKKAFPANKGFTIHEKVGQIKRVSYSADEGH